MTGPARIASALPPLRLIAAIRAAGAVTVEAWFTPAAADQSGPARIVTLSSSTGARNLTIGQDGGRVDVRCRTTETDANGTPSLASPEGAIALRRMHVVYTREAGGPARLYIDGAEVASGGPGGDLSGWDDEQRLALGDELSGDRPWRGTIHRVAFHGRALSAGEVRMRSGRSSRFDLMGVPARGGLLTQGSVLTIGGDDASMVARGLFILRDILGGRVGSPPPCVDTTPVPAKAGQSRRAIAEARVAAGSCGGCHARFEPLAFALEKLDGTGAYHEVDEHGNELREDGTIALPGEEAPVSFRSAAELMDILAASGSVRRNLTSKVAQFALGRPLGPEDDAVLASIDEAAAAGGGTYASLIRAIVLSDLVQSTRTEKDP